MDDVRQSCFSGECAGDERLFVWDAFKSEYRCVRCRTYESTPDRVGAVGCQEPDSFPLWSEMDYDSLPEPKPLPETVVKAQVRVVGKARRKRAAKAAVVARYTGQLDGHL